MISQKTIDQVNELDLEAVISNYVVLKKSGSTLAGSSPFADEKTASFMVSPSKGIWKCFSSGEGGNNPISFVMKSQNMDFPEAVKEICEKHNIEIEYDDSELAAKYQELKIKQHDINQVNNLAAEFFKGLDDKKITADGRLNKSQIEEFGVGFADNNYKSLLQFLTGKGVSEKKQIEAGLLTSGDKGVFDFFNNRIIFPIHNHQKKIVGFGGRLIGEGKAKYLNTKETKLFNKSTVLYGIHLAKNYIANSKKAVIVEGYYDVIALHSNNIRNTVSPSGTAFTEQQAELLKRWSKTIRLILDSDKAGMNAASKSLSMLLELGFNVEICLLPENEDPDSIIRNKEIKKIIKKLDIDSDGSGFEKYLDSLTVDAIEWQVSKYYEGAKTTIQKSDAQIQTESLLSLIPDPRRRNSYVKAVAQKWKISKTEIEKNIKLDISSRTIIEDEGGPKLKLPEGTKKEDYENYGFVERVKQGSNNTGYWFPTVANNTIRFEKKSNFVIKPLFHIYAKNDNKRLIEITNKKITRIIDVSSKSFVGMNLFLEAVIDEGNFLFHGSKFNFQKVVMKIMEMFPTCVEIKTLGWQQEGFYAFSNGIAEDSFKKIDKNGIVQFDDTKYFLPAFSDVYKNVRQEDDLYENDRFFVYKKAEVTMEAWTKQFCVVHGENGKIGICFFISCLFRDYIYRIHKVYPHLFAFGDVETGKSYFARSLNSIFHGDQPGFNLSAGTNVGFYRKLEKFRNGIAWFDEYENDIDQKRFQGLKAAFDGLGHEKGVMSQDSRTATTKINSASIISGQYLPTKDGNALFTRSIVLTFKRKAEELTVKDIENGSILKKWERAGLSSMIIEIIKYRSEFESKFQGVTVQITEEMQTLLKDDEYSGRILHNFILILAPFKILMDKLTLPFSYEEMRDLSIKMIIKQSEQVSDSDALRTFWKMVEYLLASHQITPGIDFKVEEVNDLRIKLSKEKITKTFQQPTKLLFIRFTKIHPLYMEAHRKQMGENGIAETSLKQYMNSNKSFVGLCPSTQFENGKSSAYVFEYDLAGVELEGFVKSPKQEEEEKEELPF